jgi:hypothetical protein
MTPRAIQAAPTAASCGTQVRTWQVSVMMHAGHPGHPVGGSRCLQVLGVARYGAGECYICADVPNCDMCGVYQRVEVELPSGRRADVLGLTHFLILSPGN